MQYTIKKTDKPLKIDPVWNSPQWESADVLQLDYYMGDKPAHFPKTKVKLLYDNNYLYVIFMVDDCYVKAVASSINGEVWKDSCAEFFFAPNPDKPDAYFNLEANCGGTVLFRYNDINNNYTQYLTSDDCKKLEITSSLPKIISSEIRESTGWVLSYKIPFDVISEYCEIVRPAKSVTWRANFYKCADSSSHPHWLTWSFIDNKTPNFHLPQYFGTLIFD